MLPVDFDLEYGPKITKVYPPLALSTSEAENVCVQLQDSSSFYPPHASSCSAFSSFPDAPQVEQGSHIHSFRIRLQTNLTDEWIRDFGQRPVAEDGFMYGFSHFTQRRDSSSKRGYQQVTFLLDVSRILVYLHSTL